MKLLFELNKHIRETEYLDYTKHGYKTSEQHEAKFSEETWTLQHVYTRKQKVTKTKEMCASKTNYNMNDT